MVSITKMSPPRQQCSLSDLFKRDLFSILDNNSLQEIRYNESRFQYVWSKTMMRMVLEIQCLTMALIVTSQVWILTSYGSRVFEHLVGNEIALPLLYLLAILMGTLTYARPTYWRIAMSLTIYAVCIYFSMLVTNVAVKILMTPGLAEALQTEPENSGVWIPWSIGFALHMQICISSIVVAMISIRDMYMFDPHGFASERCSTIAVSPIEIKQPIQTFNVQHTMGNGLIVPKPWQNSRVYI